MPKIQYKDPQVTVFESALFRTTSTLIETADLILLIDPNWLPEEIENIQMAVKKCAANKPFYLLFTHSDYDHIIGYQAFPDAQIIASQAFVDNTGKEKIVQQIKDWDDENYIKRTYPITYPQVDIVIKEDGQQMSIGETSLTFYHAAGHNIDGIFTIVEPLGIWIAGDYLSNIEFPYIYHSSIIYEETLAKTDTILTNHQINKLITGHGDIAFSETEILQRKADSHQYIHTLRNALQSNVPFNFDHLMQDYDFPKIMRQFHDGNVALIQKELTKN